MTTIIRALDQKPAARVEASLFRVRWILLLLVIPVVWLDAGSEEFLPAIGIWLAIGVVGNLVIGAVLRFRPGVNPKLATFTFLFDVLLYLPLPHLVNSTANLLAFFLIFPSVVGAIRFGPHVGLIVAALLALPVEARAVIPAISHPNWNALTSGLPVAAVLASAALVGYVSQHEKEEVIRQAAMELEELRHALAGAKLLYQTTDTLSSTTSYGPVLEAMLEAGVKGLPSGRHEDGPAIGIALFFDDEETSPQLHMIASRHLDARDTNLHIAGKEGIVGDALQSGSPIVFENVQADPELSTFSSLKHCRSGVCYPLQAGLEQYGVVVLAGPAPRRPSDQHLELMRAFTNQAALAFQNAKLYQNLRAEHDQIIRNENEMRQKLARDLHDGPTQKIAALVMQMEHIGRLVDRNPAEAKIEVEKARLSAQQTVKEIRTTLFSLRPLSLETKGLSVALEQYGDRIRETENIPLQMEAGEFGKELDQNVAGTVFSIVDEAVNNARKHAPGAPIHARVFRQNGSLIATIQDQGPGFDIDKVMRYYDERSSLGLQNMRERARLIDADLRIDSQPGRGTRITLVVPNPERQPKAEVQAK